MKSVSFALVMMLAVSGVALAHGNEKHKSGALKAHSEITAQGQCVEQTDVMRRQHMEFILHQRDKTMRQGIRTSKHSLKNCVNCHADPETKSVLGEKGFCQECHSYAAVTVDCFSCHTDKAQPGVAPIPALPTASAPAGEKK